MESAHGVIVFLGTFRLEADEGIYSERTGLMTVR